MEPSLNLQGIAASVCEENSDDGAIVISANADGRISIGIHGLDPDSVRELLCAAIHLSYVLDENIEFEEEDPNKG